MGILELVKKFDKQVQQEIGKKIGRIEGFEEGREEGAIQTLQKNILRMHQKGLDVNIIADLLGIEEEFIQNTMNDHQDN